MNTNNHMMTMLIGFIAIAFIVYVIPLFATINPLYLQSSGLLLFIGLHIWMMKAHHNHEEHNTQTHPH